MDMILQNGLPEPNSVIDDLRPIIVTVMEALDKGIAEASELQRDRRWTPDLDLANMWVRKWVREALSSQAAAIDVKEFVVDNDVRMVGLRFTYGRYDVAVWKTPDGAMPRTGNTSPRKKAFLGGNYVQARLWNDDDAKAWDRASIVLIWRVTQTYEYHSLSIALPMQPGDAYWIWQLPHMADLIQPNAAPDSPPPGGLPFEREDDEETGQAGESE